MRVKAVAFALAPLLLSSGCVGKEVGDVGARSPSREEKARGAPRDAPNRAEVVSEVRPGRVILVPDPSVARKKRPVGPEHDFFGGFEDFSKVVFEAEDAVRVRGAIYLSARSAPPREEERVRRASRGECLAFEPRPGEVYSADYKLRFTRGGRYYIHVRLWASCGASRTTLCIDGSDVVGRIVSPGQGHWHWVRVTDAGGRDAQCFSVQKGDHVLTLRHKHSRCMCGGAIRVDQILLTCDPEHVPIGTEG